MIEKGSQMKIFIIGPANSGKTTTARLLAEELDCKHAETGHVLMNRLAELFAASEPGNKTVTFWFKQISLCKDEYRQALAALGDLMTSLQSSCLIDACACRASIIAGVRRQCEVWGHLAYDRRIDDKSVWIKVKRPGAKMTAGDNYDLDDFKPHFELVNDGSLDVLGGKVRELADEIRTHFSS